jgi:hypothetical protein
MPSLAFLLAFATQTQTPAAAPPRPAGPSPAVATAARAVRPPVIDGRDDDEVWRTATPMTEFREFSPREDADPRYATMAKVAYDARNFYAFVRAYDPHPDSILRLLSRRDTRAPTDQIKIIIDSYHDRRTGYELAVNPAGVKRDYSVSDDGDEDGAWDGVWEVATTVDSLGWTAEFRVPLSQMRYVPSESNTFGFGVWRDLQRTTERFSWPVYRNSRPGLMSQLGEITGLTGLDSPRRLEVSPYGVTKNVSVPTASGFGREQRLTAGADIKYGLTSNLTLDATVNPDFGQIEADPAVLNLGAFETFFGERRPFFIEGTGIFRFNVDCSQVNCNGEGLFYSRRIGRAPQLGGRYGDATSPTASTILGAGKLTGRLPGGLTLGVLDAVTERAAGTADRTIEPFTNFAAVRVQQDFRHGESGVGGILTTVRRNLDQWTSPYLRSSATVGAVDFRHRFLGGKYQLSGSFDLSRVEGSAPAIAATQRSSVHYFQRPDGALTYDTTRTSLGGDAEEVFFSKVGGRVTHFESTYQRRSPGFEINDMGFLLRADQQSWNTWYGLSFNRPTRVYQRAFWNFNWWQYWTAAGLPTERAFNTNLHSQLNSRWWVHAGGTLGQLGGVLCDRCTRGGPALRVDGNLSAWGGIAGDDRKKIVPELWLNYFSGDGGRSVFRNVNPFVSLRVSARFNTSLGVSYSWNHDDAQWFGNFTDLAAITHYTFARLDQRTGSINWRVDYTISPTLSVQVYAQPFVSKGTYSNVREASSPRASRYQDRYAAYGDTAVTNNPGGFNFKQFRSNTVLRWEYRPGSTLFLVWTQGRQDYTSAEGTNGFGGDFRDLFRTRPDNTLLVKASYWLSW